MTSGDVIMGFAHDKYQATASLFSAVRRWRSSEAISGRLKETEKRQTRKSKRTFVSMTGLLGILTRAGLCFLTIIFLALQAHSKGRAGHRIPGPNQSAAF